MTAREISNNDMGLTIRTFGVGGLFGYFGKFFNSKIGRLTMYGTRRNNTVLIETDNKKIILTPDDPIEFLKHKEKQQKPIKKRQFGCAKGKIKMLEGFDEPLEDFKEYM